MGRRQACWNFIHAHMPAKTHHVVIQNLDVSPEIAERVLQLVRANGPVTSAFCASASSAILRQIPKFEGIGQTMFPNRLAANFGKIRDAREQKLYEYDDADKRVALEAYDPNRIKQK